jgi:hypothetical protein
MLAPNTTVWTLAFPTLNCRGNWWGKRTSEIFNYLPLLQMAILHMGLLHWLLRFCHHLFSSATQLGPLLTWQATSPIQRGIGRGNDPHAIALSFTLSRPPCTRFIPFSLPHGTLAEAVATAEDDEDIGWRRRISSKRCHGVWWLPSIVSQAVPPQCPSLVVNLASLGFDASNSI